METPNFSNGVKFKDVTAKVKVGQSNLTLSVGGQSLSIPNEFPKGKKISLGFDLFGKTIVAFYYESDWAEFRLKCYGQSVVLCHKRTLQLLPNVAPETVVYPNGQHQMIIGQVEKSPHGCPCAAILPTDKIGTTDDVASLYVFPEKPIIIEGFASTAGAGRVHLAENIAGTGCTFGDVPHIYAWVSPDKKEHGWALALYKKWEIDGVPRPKSNWEEDRIIYYDPIWYETTPDEPYTLYLGNQTVNFPSLPLNRNDEITRLQIQEVFEKSLNK